MKEHRFYQAAISSYGRGGGTSDAHLRGVLHIRFRNPYLLCASSRHIDAALLMAY